MFEELHVSARANETIRIGTLLWLDTSCDKHSFTKKQPLKQVIYIYFHFKYVHAHTLSLVTCFVFVLREWKNPNAYSVLSFRNAHEICGNLLSRDHGWMTENGKGGTER